MTDHGEKSAFRTTSRLRCFLGVLELALGLTAFGSDGAQYEKREGHHRHEGLKCAESFEQSDAHERTAAGSSSPDRNDRGNENGGGGAAIVKTNCGPDKCWDQQIW